MAATAGELERRPAGQADPGRGHPPRRSPAQRARRAARDDGSGARISAASASRRRRRSLVPLTFRGASSGVLLALDREAEGPGFGVEDERLLRSFAASAATAVATREIGRGRAPAPQPRGRRAGAQALGPRAPRRDAAGPRRAAHAALGGAARGRRAPPRCREALRQGVELIDTEIDNLSALIAELRPAALDEIGLVPALRTLAERKGREGGAEHRGPGAPRGRRARGCRPRPRASSTGSCRRRSTMWSSTPAPRARRRCSSAAATSSRSASTTTGEALTPPRAAAASA